MKKIMFASVVMFLALSVIALAAPSPTPKATGGIWMGGDGAHQQIIFSAFGTGNPATSKGSVEYWNYDYPGPLHYVANVLCADVDTADNQASFVFQIPSGWPGLSGLYVLAHVTDLGTPGTAGDTYGHTVVGDATSCSNSTAVTNYAVTAGNLVVH